ncbi:hypothetical protein YSY43_39460 [Paenibacillus sp. YSY-4.3]
MRLLSNIDVFEYSIRADCFKTGEYDQNRCSIVTIEVEWGVFVQIEVFMAVLSADLVVTLCGDAADKCPITPPQVRREHWGFDDPAKAQGTDDEKWAVFQRVRDQVGERIKKFAETGE